VIYLFCNQRYGKNFIEVARQFSDRYHARITIAFSDKTRSQKRRGVFSKAASFIKDTVDKCRFAHHERMPLLIVEDVNSPAFNKIIQPSDQGIVAGFNQIFREGTIRRFKSLVNFHPSILPLYRGPVPSYWCIKNGENTTGFTLHEITTRIDDGDILAQRAVPIGAIKDPEILDQKIAEYAMETFRGYLKQLQTGEQIHKNKLDAKSIYKRHIRYASFPKGVT